MQKVMGLAPKGLDGDSPVSGKGSCAEQSRVQVLWGAEVGGLSDKKWSRGRKEPPGELWGGGMQSSKRDSSAAFCLKREKSKEKLRVSFKAFELIPWGENRESEGEAGLRSERDGAFGIRKLDVKIVHCDGIRTHQNTTCKVGY